MLELNKIYNTDALSGLKQLPDKSISLFISSPPYWALRSYLSETDPLKSFELGQEPYFKDYIDNLLKVFKEVYRVLRPNGQFYLNLKNKTLKKKLLTPHWIEFTDSFRLFDFKSGKSNKS